MVFKLQERRIIVEGKFINNQISISMISAIRIDAHVIYLIWRPNKDFHLDIHPKGQCITYLSSNPIYNQCFTVNVINQIFNRQKQLKSEVKDTNVKCKVVGGLMTFTFKPLIPNYLAHFVCFWFTWNTKRDASNSVSIYILWIPQTFRYN